jgi:hypothetical protein
MGGGFFGAFAKLPKAAVSFMSASARPSVRVKQLVFRGSNFMRYGSIFLKSVEKIQVSFKSDKNNGYFT